MIDLELELASAAKRTSLLTVRRLVSLGVSLTTVAELRRDRWGYGVAPVADAGGGLFSPGEGPQHLLLPVHDDGELVDLVAFRANDPANWLVRTGHGWALGLDLGLEAHCRGNPVPLWATPLDWLRADCSGLCVLDWGAPEIRYLLDLPHLECASAELAAILRSALSRPVRFPTISVGELSLAA